MASEKSALLAYHLAKNPDKLAELNRMSDRERAREIGRLEATLKLPEGKKQTTAPPPPSTAEGRCGPARRARAGARHGHALPNVYSRPGRSGSVGNGEK